MRVEFQALSGRRIDVLAKLASLDARSVEKSWPMSKFDAELGRKHTHGIGAVDSLGNLLAYLIYDSSKGHVTGDVVLTVVRLVVSPDYRRKRIATGLMGQLERLAKMMMAGDVRVVAEVSEKNVEAWKFFREYGRRSKMKCNTYLVKSDPDDYFGFTFSVKEQLACV